MTAQAVDEGPGPAFAVLPGVTICRGPVVTWIIVEPSTHPADFEAAIDILGVRGRMDYTVEYDPHNGSELYTFRTGQ